ncbi:hypothetical protein [Methylovulum psychrotolerans]|uniref:EF-hand domain-containing protein n=1 Tax=Methylovulum psychrotolerans TaxID=1704499 RepID=A0A2S5CHK3_9GAMM|nr:hypothetical protein [Methylovulum psychrotolerans]POZ50247.1 hypothetical protein AADEFJLK_03996 [Methylovulum psychrotolerans]
MPTVADTSTEKKTHQWQFVRVGGFDQVKLERTEDLIALAELDQKLWTALSCPTQGLYFDPRTLALLDTDKDGRIRAPEIVVALQWTTARLINPLDIKAGHSVLPLAAIDQSHPEGAKLLASAREILKIINKPEANEISVDDVTDIAQIFAQTPFNGDGVIPVQAVDDETYQQVIADILSCVGGEPDRCGELGVTQAKVDDFFSQVQAYIDWWHVDTDDNTHNLLLGEDALIAVENFKQLKPKIDDYFTRCQLAEFDPQAATLLNPSIAQYEQLALHDLSATDLALLALPLASIAANKPLPLNKGLNPAWAVQISQLNQAVFLPLLGRLESLSWAQWQEAKAKFVGYDLWLQSKPAEAVERLSIERLQALLAGDYQHQLSLLIAKDQALAAEAEAIESVERLIYYYRDLYRLLNNFVSFRDFYSSNPHSIFQAGTLFLDGRSCSLCIRVTDIAKHSALASSSLIFLAYCDCTRPGTQEKMTIAAAFTGGDADNLLVGRNGIFYDRQGGDWDATIVKIIDHPISIGQAFWSPYQRLGKMLAEQIEKFAAARDKEAQAKTLAGSTAAISATEAAPVPFDAGKFAGIFAAIGLAIGAIGAAIASIVSGFLSLVWWQMPLSLLGILLFISGPSMLIASFKLHRRNLAPILDASGWAINTKAYINIPFGHLLTSTAKLPKNAERQLLDPFATKKAPWRSFLVIGIILGALVGAWQQNLFQHKSVKPVKQEVAEKVVPPAVVAPVPTPASAVAPAKN